MAEMSMVEKVARAIHAKHRSPDDNQHWFYVEPEHCELSRQLARAAIEAMPIEQLIIAAYVRGVEWNEENPLDREYRFKAAGDYADKTLFAALSEEVAG